MGRPRVVCAALVALAAVAALGCNPDDVVHRIGWFSTMRHQRNLKPYARPIAPVEGTVPVSGREPAVTLDNAARVTNPRTRTSESLNRGQWVYETYCLVCHGEAGRGDGPISPAGGGPFPIPIPSLVDDQRRRLSDGFIYGVITNAQEMGKGIMPRYGDRVRGTDRWDLVNYVRSLQLQAAR